MDEHPPVTQIRMPDPIHYAWVVLGAVMLVMIAASGLRSVFGVFIKPLEADFHWDRAARWFETHRGLVIGLLGGAMSAGQLVVVPLAMGLTVSYGWRQSYFWLGVALFALILPLSIWLVRDGPREKGVKPYGAGHAVPSPGTASLPDERRVSVTEAAQVPAFWLLVATFFVCGYTSSGLVLTHLIPHSMEHGFSEMAAAQALGVMGAMNILGTVASGWICDRFGRKGPLAFYYFVRGLSLLFLLYVWNVPSLHLFAALFGLNYISTVPPTPTLTANIFGRYSVGELSGWIFFSHQVGAALGAADWRTVASATHPAVGQPYYARPASFSRGGLSLMIK